MDLLELGKPNSYEKCHKTLMTVSGLGLLYKKAPQTAPQPSSILLGHWLSDNSEGSIPSSESWRHALHHTGFLLKVF